MTEPGKMGVHKRNSTAILFIHILMHGREGWVLVYLGSQQKHVERPVQPECPDYLSVSGDYAIIYNLQKIFTMTLIVRAR